MSKYRLEVAKSYDQSGAQWWITPSGTGPLIAALTECVACLERYCGPGTRGHEARKKAKELLKGVGVEVDPA